jgi:hypothetical protein
MKSISIILLGLVMTLSSIAQQKSTLININLQQVSFDKIISELEKQSGYLFTYDANLVNVNQKYSIAISNKNIDETLTEWLSALKVDYKKTSSQIILKAKKSKKKYTISGTIKEKDNGETIEGVSIRILNTSTGAVSNSYGFYTITLDEGAYDIVYSYFGMKKDTIHFELYSNIKKRIIRF